MKTFGSLTSLLLAALLMAGNATAVTTGELLQQGLYAEEVEGNMETAIKLYGQVIADHSAQPNQTAQALYRQGLCYLKLKDEAAARTALEKLVADYPNQSDLVQKARPVLDDLTDFDPASLMPAGTLVYVEFGNPGKQFETILSLLKGTPFENPLAAIGGKPAANPSQKTPGDIVAALLNPSMTAEFKKIRSSAIGFTGLAQNNPPMISVLFPGNSDALRGLLLAALGMGGSPGPVMDGMQTVNLKPNEKQTMAVAYDDRVFILANPADQLAWCVKQYKGLTSDPTLATARIREEVQNLTGLELGRELFANREQVTVFAMPTAADGAAAEFLPASLGVALTSRSIDRFVTTLRNKIEPDPARPIFIHTIRQIGYRFEPPEHTA